MFHGFLIAFKDGRRIFQFISPDYSISWQSMEKKPQSKKQQYFPESGRKRKYEGKTVRVFPSF